jgi:hypothetical protein
MDRPKSGIEVILRVVEISWAGGTRLRLAFNDGQRKLVDLRPLLEGPVFEPLRVPEAFSRVGLDYVCGTVVWPNGADLAPEALHALPSLHEAAVA